MRRYDRAVRFVSLLTGNAGRLSAALGWVILVRIGLSLVSFKALRAHLVSPVPASTGETREAARTAWAVRHAARLVPYASCLTQALACQIMLSRRNIDSTLHIGARRDQANAFTAHAWLSAGDRILLGGTRDSVGAYAKLAEYRA